ncbi:MAG: riboflavin synthase [Terrimicrobiaceae bacterium]|nr:riboflavin synthase [Terrimicrobiaceae bacterium]
MFTGLVETTGILRDFTDTPQGRRLSIETPALAPVAVLGESTAVNGCCLTIAGISGPVLRFDLLAETLRATNFGRLVPGSRVNLERALAATSRLGGHFVQGHIDCTATVLEVDSAGPDLGLGIELPADFARYVVAKGSIAINGVSLTVARLEADRFGVWIIPHTRVETNLGDLRTGDHVNLEFDLLAKYTERLLAARH